MVLMVLERVPATLRGELTRWMLELKPGVFVGSMSALVRDKLWNKACRQAHEGGCIMVHSSNTEQGFKVRFWGEPSRDVVDHEGLALVRMHDAQSPCVRGSAGTLPVVGAPESGREA